MDNTSIHEFTWRSGHLTIRIAVAYSPRLHVYDHLGISSIQPEKAPLPITWTGYFSHYLPAGSVADFGGPEEATRKFLNAAAESPLWQDYLSTCRQGSLF